LPIQFRVVFVSRQEPPTIESGALKKTLLANQLPEGRGPVIEPQMTENENEKWSGPNAVPRHGGPFTSNYRS
jgi:hypothetical protein